ncbi:hypothetical protein CO046_04460 [Candidatus Peregrinibacteria bacterium CG_4_9_14_0_2_um_filter_53_11]|nr:MAG: hypothetical protein CO046_04460 [Candidatus Peregrinibacteria bacterium CG_4_9_14_0_2_um_filter_53_11]
MFSVKTFISTLKQKSRAQHEGFTLIELIIALSVFMLFLTLSTGAYINLVRANREAGENQKIYRDIRRVFDTLAEDIRSKAIDFTCVDQNSPYIDASCLTNFEGEHQTVIALIDTKTSPLERTLYRFANGGVESIQQTLDLNGFGWTTLSGWHSLTADTTVFDGGYFEVFPLNDPYAQENVQDDEIQWQPSVGITLKYKRYTFKTTYSSRFYGTTALYSL